MPSRPGLDGAGLDLALGVPLLAIGALIATGRVHGRRRASAKAGTGQTSKAQDWAQRISHNPRCGLIVLIGVVCGAPGGEHVVALHVLVNGKSPAAAQAWGRIFVLLEFLPVIISFVFLVVKLEGASARVRLL